MTKSRQGALGHGLLVGFLSALLFSVFALTGLFVPLENKLYDFFLRHRPHRERSDLVVFLDVDNEAIAFNGVFPWPRSVMADGLLRLKEYGTLGVIFDIEYVDKGPQGVDNISLEALPFDFYRTFSELDGGMSDVINGLFDGHLSRAEALGLFSSYIDDERDQLLRKALNVARDNDDYLARASALYGNSWATVNLRDHPLEGEQASRRAMAEELFSYPIKTNYSGKDFPWKSTIEGILPPIPSFARAAKGAGFTRAYVDGDGVRRRIDLVQEYNGFWYLQVAFAPLVNYLGNPAIELEKNRLILRDVSYPLGKTKDLVIPLDANGRMLLDWPATSFEESFEHFSFAYISMLEQAQARIERTISILSFSENLYNLIAWDNTLAEVPALLYRIVDLFTAANEERARALAETSDEAFAEYLTLRNEAWDLLYRFRDLDFPGKINALGKWLAMSHPSEADLVRNESDYLEGLARNILFSLEDFDAIQGKLKNALKGKYCVVGQTDTGTTDIGVNPFYNEYVNVGTQGAVIDTILSESFIVWLSPLWSAIFCILAPLMLFLLTNLAPALRSALGFLFALLAFLFLFFMFRFFGFFLDPISPVLSLITAVVVREIIAQTASDRERQFIRKAFSTYVSDDVVEEIIADPSKLQLGGTKRHMSAIFTDIQGFSTISEQLDPEDLVNLLNQYLTTMSDVILKEKGTIDKYEGDAIIAFFGAPLELPDHAIRACLSAITIKRKEEELNKLLLEEKLSSMPLLTRIGINTGSIVAGNMGTKNKMNYTIMGNAVNLASRLEGVNKQYGTYILTTRATLDETGEMFLSRKLDKVRVVGINEPVQLYELLGTRDEAKEWQKEMVQHFENAISLFEKRDWTAAAEAFQCTLISNPNDSPSRIYLGRCEAYQKNPPQKDWDGVFNLDSK
ncbi:MAG: adenylate/guanylate cyclase domain-containing protein [Treponema sp.]|jgi:adenylate cyclase|nr:adenylate/guanylate cyclase domain-containing protein [Treponema sp.]